MKLRQKDCDGQMYGYQPVTNRSFAISDQVKSTYVESTQADSWFLRRCGWGRGSTPNHVRVQSMRFSLLIGKQILTIRAGVSRFVSIRMRDEYTINGTQPELYFYVRGQVNSKICRCRVAHLFITV